MSRSAWETSREAVVFASFSKYFSMTGWRIGWMLVPERLRRPVDVLTGNFTICPPAIAQYAAIAAFDDASYAELDGHVARYAGNRALLLDGLPQLGIDRLAPADGAFYAYADVGHLTDDSLAFCHDLLAETGVAVAPGHRLRHRGRQPVHPVQLRREARGRRGRPGATRQLSRSLATDFPVATSRTGHPSFVEGMKERHGAGPQPKEQDMSTITATTAPATTTRTRVPSWRFGLATGVLAAAATAVVVAAATCRGDPARSRGRGDPDPGLRPDGAAGHAHRHRHGPPAADLDLRPRHRRPDRGVLHPLAGPRHRDQQQLVLVLTHVVAAAIVIPRLASRMSR